MENVKRIHTLKFDNSSDEYVLNDAKANNAWAYGLNAQALTDTATAIGTNTKAGTTGYPIANITNQTDIYLTTIADTQAFLKNDKVGIFTKDESFYWFNTTKILDIKVENDYSR